MLERAARDGERLDDGTPTNLPQQLAGATLGTVAIYNVLFATGFFIYSDWIKGAVCTAFSAGASLALIFLPSPGRASTFLNILFQTEIK